MMLNTVLYDTIRLAIHFQTNGLNLIYKTHVVCPFFFFLHYWNIPFKPLKIVIVTQHRLELRTQIENNC